MSIRGGGSGAAPTRWRSTYTLAEPEPEHAGPESPPPLGSWRSTGNLHGAGTLPRPWSRQRTGTNVQRLLSRLQSHEDDEPQRAWADRLDDGQTTDAPRARLRTELSVEGGARRQPRPRPRSMGVLLGLRQADESDEEREGTRSAGWKSDENMRQKQKDGPGALVSSGEPPERATVGTRRGGTFGTGRAYDALDSRSRGITPGLYRTGSRDLFTGEPAGRGYRGAAADSYTASRAGTLPNLSQVGTSESRRRESSLERYAATGPSARLSGYRRENSNTADTGAPYSTMYTQTLPSTARYMHEKSATAQNSRTPKLSDAEASIIREVRNAAKAASGSISSDAERFTSANGVPEKRRSLNLNRNSSVADHERSPTWSVKTPPGERASEVGKGGLSRAPDLTSQVDRQQPQSGRATFRRNEVRPAVDADMDEVKPDENTGKVEVKIVGGKLKAVKDEVQPAEAKANGVENDAGIVRARAMWVEDDESQSNDDDTMDKLARIKVTKTYNVQAAPGDAETKYQDGNSVEDRRRSVSKQRTPSIDTQILVVNVDEKPVQEPTYKPVAAPRRLTASGMTLGQPADTQAAPRVVDLGLSSDSYMKIRSRGSGRLVNTKEALTTAVPMNERGSGLRARGEVQDFEKLRAECLGSGRLFEDPEFPATDCSIFFSRTPPRPFQWKRPHEICSNPKFILKGATRFDVLQGELGDCWLLAAVANITMNQELFAQVVPTGQELDEEYAGIFHFRFWQYGRWVDVVIDDRLPTYHGQLAFMHSQDNREFWSALLEKAYAKLHGSYEALKGGTTCEAMEDFSGGVTEMYDIDQAPDNLFQVMLKANQRQSLMSCSIEPDPYVVEAEMANGLIKGHAYSVTKACLADIETPRVQGKIPMVRVRNPWGNEAEWKGAFSDKSQEWNYISEETRRELGLTFDADGEFWMTFKDFSRNFQRLEICNLSPDSLDDDDDEASRRWEMSVFEGAWVRGATAGGCRNYINTFAHNPQYRIELHDVDEDDEEHKCTVIVAVMQKNRRAQRRLGLDCLTIGFSIYHLGDPDSAPKPLDSQFFRYNCSVARAPSFINLREVSCRFKLPPGTYCIIPSTFEPNEEGEFLIRIFSEKRNNMEENDEEVGPGQVSEEIKPELVQESEYDRTVRQFFTQIAGDNLEVDWRELKEVLDYALNKEFKFDGFSKDTIRSMVALLDVDNSGQLGLEEFKSLWGSIRLWKSVFKKHDRSGSSFLSGFQLRAALNESGYRVNNNMLNLLMHRYGDRDGRVAFDDFMACAVKMKTCIEIFKDKDPSETNKATFSLEDWMEHNMYS